MPIRSFASYRRALWLLAASVVVVFFLAACRGKGTPAVTTEPANGTAQPSDETAILATPVTGGGETPSLPVETKVATAYPGPAIPEGATPYPGAYIPAIQNPYPGGEGATGEAAISPTPYPAPAVGESTKIPAVTPLPSATIATIPSLAGSATTTATAASLVTQAPGAVTATATRQPTTSPTPQGTPARPTTQPVPTKTPLPTPTPPLPAVDPDLHATDPATVRLGAGKVQLVEFFAFWCVTCMEIAPTVNGLEAVYQDRMNFIFLDIDDPANAGFKSSLGFRREPQLFLLDASGNVLKQWQGFVTEADLRGEIEAALP